jgi:hypothetical protein
LEASVPIRAVTVQLAVAVAIVAAAPSFVRAHFVLRAPACYSEQDGLGTPIKSAPCGQADPGNPVQLTGAVTTFTEGETLMVEVEEIIFHPGHFRVAIAEDMGSLPDDPPVTAGSSPCGSTIIDPSPTLPVLVDGALAHDSGLSGPRTIAVQLPPGFTCDNCVLQVTQFMSEHELNDPGGCFYHHCADVRVLAPGTDGGATTRDAGTASDGGTTPPRDSGCGCRVGGEHHSGGALPIIATGVLALARAGARARARLRARPSSHRRAIEREHVLFRARSRIELVACVGERELG